MTYLSRQMDIYPFRLIVAHSKDQWKQVRKDVPSIEDDAEEPRQTAAAMALVTTHNDENLLIFHFPKKNRLGPERKYSVIAHEATHGAAMIFEGVHEEITSSEAFAYLVEWLCIMIQGPRLRVRPNLNTSLCLRALAHTPHHLQPSPTGKGDNT